MRTTYEPRVAGARTPDEMRRMISLMLGELNASHMGISAPPAGSPTLGRLAVDFDRAEYETSGRLRVSAGRAARSGGARRHQGRRRTSPQVDGAAVDRASTSTSCSITRSASASSSAWPRRRRRTAREVVVKPVDQHDRERTALSAVGGGEARATSPRRAAAGSATCTCTTCRPARSTQLYLDLDAENHARDGVVIDVRNNNGGFVNVYAIDVFARRGYLNMTAARLSDGAVADAARPARAGAADDSRDQPAFAVGRRGLHRRLSHR